MKVNVTKPFPYSPHGHDNAQADVGVQDLPDHIATIALAEGWATQVGATKTPAGATGPTLTHDVNAKDAIDLVELADTIEELQQLKASEMAHPKFEGGRASVLAAIDAQIEALTGDTGGGNGAAE